MFFNKHSYGKKNIVGYGYRNIGSKKTFKNINTGKFSGIKKAFSLLLIIGFFGSGIYWMTFSGYFKIKKIAIDGVGKNEQLKAYFKKFIGKNLIFADLDETIEKIEKENPDIQKFEVKKIYPKEIRISFSKYAVVANINYISKKEEEKFTINEIGYSVEKNIRDPNLPIIRMISEKERDNGPVITKEKLNEILQAINFFEEKFEMKIIDTTYLMQAREIHVRTERLFSIWLDAQKPLEIQLNKLKKAVPRLDIYNLPLEYIDLRISGVNGEKIIFRNTK